ncbi:MAG TPA: 1,4-dihydroxy-2-naphthoate octaprenyltransferase [Armatimonadetes bacterium]|nr:1,4-dihydroxy-2-naphthoate octaprenyltransferase [Armatimonadota bacterium]
MSFVSQLALAGRVVRAPFFTASIVPVLVGTAVAWHYAKLFDATLFLLTLIGMIAIHTGANVLNDYFDHLSGADEAQTRPLRPFAGGSRAIQDGIVTASTMLKIGAVALAFGIAIGIYLVWRVGLPLLLIGIGGVFCAYFYTAPPIQLAHRGLGELAVGMGFGVLPVLGTYYVQAHGFDWRALLASLPIALLIAAVLWVNEFPDLESDAQVGKNHLVVRLGKQRAAIVYAFLILGAFVIMAIAVIVSGSPYPLLGWLAMPLGIRAIVALQHHVRNGAFVAPACALTIMMHLTAGVLFALGLAL